MNPRELIAEARAYADAVAERPMSDGHMVRTVRALCDALFDALLDSRLFETALRQRLNELEQLRAQVEVIQAACTRHEREARIERARAAFWKAECDVTDSFVGFHADERQLAEEKRDEAMMRREAARRVLAEYGATP